MLTPSSRAQKAAPTCSLKAPLPACDGIYALVRLTEISPSGSIGEYTQAVAAHRAWYQKHGYKHQIFAARVLERDPKTSEAQLSNHLVLTYRYVEPGSKPPVHDAEWDAYVKQYRITSSIKESYLICVPSDPIPTSTE